MIRIRHAALRDFPGVGPFHAVVVHQDSHQFRHRARRVRIVQLETILRAELTEVGSVFGDPLIDNVLQTC